MTTIQHAISTMGTVVLLLLPTTSSFAQDWQPVYEKEGVAVSKKEVADTNLVSFKGETVYQQPVSMVLGVLLDNDHRTEWVDRLVDNYILESTNEFDYVLYQAFELPAIFSDRDYVYHGVATLDDATGAVTLHMQSVEHSKAPESVGVRADLINSRYILTPLENGDTRVEVEILTDPKGLMPAWFVNLITKSWPVATLNGIRGQFDKGHVKPHKLPGEDDQAGPEEAEAPSAEDGETEAVDGGAAEDAPSGEAATEDAPGEEAPAEAAPAEAAPAEAAPAEAAPAEAAPAEAAPAAEDAPGGGE